MSGDGDANGGAPAGHTEDENAFGDAINDAFAAMATADPAEHEFDELQYIDGVDDVDADTKADGEWRPGGGFSGGSSDAALRPRTLRDGRSDSARREAGYELVCQIIGQFFPENAAC